jgi:hypothetical protein
MFVCRKVFALAALCWLLTAGVASAEQDVELKAARDNLDLVMTVVAQSVLAAMNCTHTDEGAWYLVIASIDRRQDFCVRHDANWEKLSVGWEAERAEAEGMKLIEARVGSYAYLRKMRELPKEIASGGGFDNFCSAVPWKFLLAPNTTTSEQRESFARSHPDVDINATIAVFTTVRNLGLAREWIERPCEKGFWPTTFVRQKR